MSGNPRCRAVGAILRSRHIGDDISRDASEGVGDMRVERCDREHGIVLAEFSGEYIESIGSDAALLY